MVPRQMRDTLSPVEPRFTYCIFPPATIRKWKSSDWMNSISGSALAALRDRYPGRFANDQLRLHHNFFGKLLVRIRNHIQQHLGAFASHLAQRLPYCSKTGLVIGGAHDVVEADDRNIFGHAQAGIVNRTDNTDGRDVVEAKDGSEVARARKKIAHRFITHSR